MGHIIGLDKEPEQQGFNEHTLEWQGKKLKDMQHKELVDIIVRLFQTNLAQQAELKTTQRILS